jgi:hypothetical protein
MEVVHSSGIVYCITIGIPSIQLYCILTMADDSYRLKRSRSSSSSSSASTSHSRSSFSPSPGPQTKYHRTITPSTSSLYTCDSPPTCHGQDQQCTFQSLADLETHKERFHRYICEAQVRDKAETAAGEEKRWKACGKVFPEERLLELVRRATCRILSLMDTDVAR